jgi:hypothetical protein
LRIWREDSSGRISMTGSSRVTRPRSTHWRAAMLVRSLVQDAIIRVLLKEMGGASGAGDVKPEALE